MATDQRQIQQVALAALLHDVGKFAQRAEADPESCPPLPNPRDFVVADARGKLSYQHAAYTWHFIEDNFRWLTASAGKEGNVARWAACHHKPTAVWEWVVAEANRLSAGFDNGHPDEGAAGWANVHTARLAPLLSRIGGAAGADGLEIALAPLAMDERLFRGRPPHARASRPRTSIAICSCSSHARRVRFPKATRPPFSSLYYHLRALCLVRAGRGQQHSARRFAVRA